MKRLVYLISTFLILTGIYGGSVGAGDLFWVSGYSGTSFQVPARKFLFNENHMSDSDRKSYVEWAKHSVIGVLDVALAQSSNGWAAGRDVSRELAKRNALKNCQNHIGSFCKIVDVNGTSTFIKQRGSSGSTTVASSPLNSNASATSHVFCHDPKFNLFYHRFYQSHCVGSDITISKQEYWNKRLNSFSSSTAPFLVSTQTSTPAATVSSAGNIWCLRVFGVEPVPVRRSYCESWAGTAFVSKHLAEAAYKRVKDAEQERLKDGIYCYDSTFQKFYKKVDSSATYCSGHDKTITKQEYINKRLKAASSTASSSGASGTLYRITPYDKFEEGGNQWLTHGDETVHVTYIGDVQNGNPHGVGVLFNPKGDVIFTGSFRDGLKNGQGVYKYHKGNREGDSYVGGYKDGDLHGQGTYTWADGRKYIGIFKKSKFWNGIGYDVNGEISGTYSAGEGCPNCSPSKSQRALVATITKMAIASSGTTATASSSTISTTTQAATAQTASGCKTIESDYERDLWNSVKDSDDPEEYQIYLDECPTGTFAKLAKSRIKKFSGGGTPTSVAQSSIPPLNYGNYYALVIGNNRYDHLGDLRTAVNDARSVASLLESDYGFNVTTLENANRDQIIKSISGLRGKVGSQDNVLIYYAGHGVLDEAADEGYWLPVDATSDDPSNWVMTDQVISQVRAMKAKHVMVVADSCFSGTITRGIKIEIKQPTREWLETIVKKKARTALTSGGLEPVMDSGGGNNSVFANSFLSILLDNDGVLDASQLFSQLRPKVMVNSDQTPEYGDIHRAGHDGGDFLFVRQ